MSLHIGDRILEINGTPVKDQPAENIENLIRYSDSVLQVKNIHNITCINILTDVYICIDIIIKHIINENIFICIYS